MKKNHYYLHEVFGRTWAILSHLYGEEDLKQKGLKECRITGSGRPLRFEHWGAREGFLPIDPCPSFLRSRR